MIINILFVWLLKNAGNLYNSILNITALLPNLNATAPKNPGWKLEQRCSICADTVFVNVTNIFRNNFLNLSVLSIFRNKRYMFDETTQHNSSNFSIFWNMKKPMWHVSRSLDHFIKHKSLISEEWWFRRSNKKKVATIINNNSFFHILTTLIGFGYNKDFLLTTNFSVWSTLSTNILHSNLVSYSFEYTILVNFCNFEYPPGLLCNWHCKKINLN